MKSWEANMEMRLTLHRVTLGTLCTK